ncbi:BREX-1 system adenine-specific DNA-methyltransferase PglX [Hymenobacter monticola]|uniref:site-specific DNA-methyltransferase (adenine-specific) n=1 Tax=Hymenobacter monticola TaxID=1705399 RepID=A0ABY4BGA1_9BACT|nr:BREX-1 system adenine-specific DNA-methyltransferase PglX [Hymenobacter monticola]UOE36766.1 BREX-1 system adenine-specific DNA-methyltransferase PglX [Hymenobacter monticola]
MTPTQRNLLRQFVADARTALYRDFEQQLPGYGIFFQQAPVAAGAPPAYTHLQLTAPAELPNADRATRAGAARLQERLHYLATTVPGAVAGASPRLAEALPRLLLEQAYTFLNRLTALRLAEEREIVMECLRRGQQSEGYTDLFSLYTSQAYPNGDARYAAFIRANFDRLARELPGLFGAYSPYGLLWPRYAAFDAVLDRLRRSELAFAWDADETLGWLYQYFNSKDEREAMRAASRAPRTSREMAVRNQFFTPRYVVEFLTDNTLGRRWRDLAEPSEALAARCRYLVATDAAAAETAPDAAAPNSIPALKKAGGESTVAEEYPLPDPRGLRVLDPACGSMHFGLYAFDVFETIYLDAWDRLPDTVLTDVRAALVAEHPTDETARRRAFQARVPGLILAHNLHGVDIDPRAIQVAGLTLWLRAHRTWQGLKLRAAHRPRIGEARLVWAEPLAEGELLTAFGRTLRHETLPGQTKPLAPAEAQVLADLLRSVAAHTRLVGEAGWLVPLEQELSGLIEAARQSWTTARAAVAQATQVDIFRGAPAQQLGLPLEALGRVRRKAFFEEAEGLLLAALTLYAEQAAGPDAYQRQLFAADAARTLALVDLCRLRYDAVLMNPPFGAAAAASKAYLERNYPSAKMDIFAMFVARALNRLRPGGFVGIISSRTGLFISSFKTFREQVLLRHHLPLVADLGGEVLDAMVETAAYVVQQAPPVAQPTFFLRLLNVPGEEKEAALLEGLLNPSAPFRFEVPTVAFDVIPGKPLAYWSPAGVRRAFETEPAFDDEAGSTKQGLASADDFRFVRMWWEKPTDSGWFTFAKGGPWSPFYIDFHLICNWVRNGEEMTTFTRSVIRNPMFYGRRGLTYPLRTHELSPQAMPAGTIISVRGQGIYPNPPDNRTAEEQNLLNLAVLASRPFDYMLKLGLGFSARPQFDGGAINRTPFPAALQLPTAVPVVAELEALARRGHAVQRAREFTRETSLHFRLPALLLPTALAGPALSESLPPALAAIAVPLPLLDSTTLAETAIAEAARATARQLEVQAIQGEINERVYEAYGFGPAERAAIAQFYAAPSSTSEDDAPAEEEEDDDTAAPGSPDDVAFALWQWLLGAAFGRWDVRLALDPAGLPAPAGAFEALPPAPPGALRHPTSGRLATTPADVADAGAPYPVPVAWSGLLPLDSDNPHDVARQLRQLLATLRPATAAALETESRALLASTKSDLTGWLGEWLGRAGAGGFFDRHLLAYSRSKREAPLYWPLQAPNTNYVLWLYAPRLSRETLYAALNDYVEPRRQRARDELRQFAELLSGPAPANAKEARQQLQRRDDVAQLVAGLDQFVAHLTSVLDQPGFQPHPDDGAAISACLLAELFSHRAWRRKLEQHRTKLRTGDYDWSHLALSLFPVRVREKCRLDRSLAIAHGLEDLYEGPLADLGGAAVEEK